MSSAQTEALVQALAPHLGGGGEEQARHAAERLPHTLQLYGNEIGGAGATAIALNHVVQSCALCVTTL